MKKTILASLLVLFAATSSFAADADTGAFDPDKSGLNVKTGTTTTIGKLSTGVMMAWNIGTNGYAIITGHKSGAKKFGTGHDSTAIMYSAFASGDTVAAPSAPSASSVAGATWTAL